VAERLILAIGLDRALLILEFREPTLIDGGFFVQCASRLLVVGQALLGRVHVRLGLVQPRVGLGKALRMRGDLLPRVGNLVVEMLKLDEAVESGDMGLVEKWKSGKVEK
jgi:hypothetical protein